MKKLIVFSAVLFFTSVLPAALVLTGSDTIEQGDTITLSLITDAPGDQEGYVWLDYASGNSAGDSLSNLVYSPPVTVMSYLPDGFYFSSMGTTVNVNSVLVQFDLTDTGTALGGYIQVDILDATASTILGSYQIEVVPEPMTLSLLVLGGMAIRKRK